MASRVFDDCLAHSWYLGQGGGFRALKFETAEFRDSGVELQIPGTMSSAGLGMTGCVAQRTLPGGVALETLSRDSFERSRSDRWALIYNEALGQRFCRALSSCQSYRSALRLILSGGGGWSEKSGLRDLSVGFQCRELETFMSFCSVLEGGIRGCEFKMHDRGFKVSYLIKRFMG